MDDIIKKYEGILEHKNTDITRLFCANLCSLDTISTGNLLGQFDIWDDNDIHEVFRWYIKPEQLAIGAENAVSDLLLSQGGWLARAFTRVPEWIGFNDDGSVKNYLLGYRRMHSAYGGTLEELLERICIKADEIFELEVAKMRGKSGFKA
ncbi:MAG: hypothetical protein K6G15_03355 [Desulfovibrio sp.]|nr:hypothetical protein [Desulfovibrio sp.]